MVIPEITSGNVLLAEPFMMDPNFRRAAVLLCEHGEEGTVGFIMNRRLSMQVDELIEDFPEFNGYVYYGGPVQTDTIHYIHNVGELLDESQYVSDGVYWGGDFTKLKVLIRQQLIQPKDIRFFAGYAGWSEGQLLDEMSYGSWVVADMDANYLFNSDPSGLWRKVMENISSTFGVIGRIPDDISYN